MNTEQTKKLALFLAEWRHSRWERGVTDCVTYILKMHDAVYGSSWYNTIGGSYNSLSSGRKLLGILNQSQWLALNKYHRTSLAPASGDIAVLKDSKIPTPYIVFEGQLYGYGNHKGKPKSIPIEQCGLELEFYRKD